MDPEGLLPYLQEPTTCPYCVCTNNITFSSVYFSIIFLYCDMAYQIQKVSKLSLSPGNRSVLKPYPDLMWEF